jgi:glycerol 3-phosphatase-2
MTWVLDLDGVVWLGGKPIAGSAEAVSELRRAGERVLFVTNNSSATIGDYVGRLRSAGVEAGPEDLVTSAQAAARMVPQGSSVLVCAGAGVEEALVERGATPVERGPCDAVIVGWHRSFDYERLTTAMRAVRGGARLIGTNDDATYPTSDGPIAGGGALLAAVSYASDADASVAGKPHHPIVELLRERADDVAIVVGDRPSTDGLLAQRLGVPFGLVLSGVTPRHHGQVSPEPDVEAADLAGLVHDKNRAL